MNTNNRLGFSRSGIVFGSTTPSCVTFGKSLHFSLPQFPICKIEIIPPFYPSVHLPYLFRYIVWEGNIFLLSNSTASTTMIPQPCLGTSGATVSNIHDIMFQDYKSSSSHLSDTNICGLYDQKKKKCQDIFIGNTVGQSRKILKSARYGVEKNSHFPNL